MFCPNCGNEVPQSARFCKYCGCKLASLKTAPSRETDIKAAYEKNIDTLAKTIAAFKETHDQSTFSSLFEQTKGIVTKAICDQGVDGRDVEDVVQQVYLTAYQKLDSLEDNRAAFAWFKRTATNKAIDHMRKADNTPILNTDYTNDTSDSSDYIESLADDTLELPEDVVENTSTQQIIRGFIQELPKDQQKFLVARYFAEMNAAQIAETFGIPAGTVRSQLSRARKTLQESILAYSERTGVKLASYSSVPVFALLANADLAPVPLALNAPSLFSTIQEAMQGLSDVTKALGEKSLSAQGAPYTNPFIDEFAKSTAAHTSQAAQTSAAQAAESAGASASSAGTSAGSAGATAASTSSASVGTKGASTATKVTSTTAKAAQAAGTVAKMSIGGKIAAGVATVAIAGATAGGVYFAGTNGLIPFIPKPYEQSAQTQNSSNQNQSTSQTSEPEDDNSTEALRKKRLKLYKEKIQELEPSFSEFYPDAESTDIEAYHMPADFKYTLVDVDGDGLEELLVEVSVVLNEEIRIKYEREATTSIMRERHDVFIFTANEDASELIKADGKCIVARSAAKEYTNTLYSINEGNGLLSLFCRNSPYVEGIETYTLNNNQFSGDGFKTTSDVIGSRIPLASCTPDVIAQDLYPGAVELEWHDSTDLSPFNEISDS